MLIPSQQATYRPAVKTAWLDHCRSASLSPNNRVAYDLWYRDQVRSAIGLDSTRDADPDRDYPRLIAWFKSLCPEPDRPPRPPKWSNSQYARYCSLVARAWRVAAKSSPLLFADWLSRECQSIDAGDDRTHSFDCAMRRFAILANDDYWIRRTAEAEEIRIRHGIRLALRDLARLSGRPHDPDYAQAVLDQMGFFLPISDAPAPVLRTVLQALCTHRSRLHAMSKIRCVRLSQQSTAL